MALARIVASSSLMYSPKDLTTSINVDCLDSTSVCDLAFHQRLEQSRRMHTLGRYLRETDGFGLIVGDCEQILLDVRHGKIVINFPARYSEIILE